MVMGSRDLVVDAVREVLGRRGFSIVQHTSAGGDGDGRRFVAVLVEPTVLHWAHARSRSARVILLTTHRLEHSATADAVLHGADAMLHMGASPDELCDAVDAVARERARLDSGQMRAVIDRVREAPEVPARRLTSRQEEILRLIDRGLSVKQTARLLGVSQKTVENHQRALFQKLSVRNRAEAVIQAHALGLLSADRHRNPQGHLGGPRL